MRMAFGILSLLISVAIMLWLMVGTGYTSAVATQNKVARQQLNVLSGKDPTGSIRAIDSIHLRVDRSGAGRPRLFIAEVRSGGPMEMKYGVKPGDRVLEVSGLAFGTEIDSRESAEEWIHTAYAADRPIVVLRENQRLVLPTPDHLAMIAQLEQQARIAATEGATTIPPSAAEASTEDERNPLQQALDSIRIGGR